MVRPTVRLSRKACPAPAHRGDLAVGVSDLGCGEDTYASWPAERPPEGSVRQRRNLGADVQDLVQEVGEQRGAGEVIAEGP
jgi:hypothetical protein